MQYQTKEQTDFDFKKENIIATNNSVITSKFKNFLSILSTFSKKLFKDNVVEKVEVEPDVFELQANEFLKNQNYEAYIKMLKQGYLPTKKQEQTMDKIVHGLFFYTSDLDDYNITQSEKLIELDNILKLGYTLKQTDVLTFIKQSNTTMFRSNRKFFSHNVDLCINCVFKVYSLPYLSNQIRSIVQEESFSDNLLKLFKNGISKNSNPTKESIAQFNSILDLSPELLLKSVTLNEFLELSKTFSPMNESKEQNTLINGIVNNYYANEMQPFYLNVKQRYTTDFIENLIVNKVKREIEVLKEIPKEALDIIQSIELTFKNIEKHNNDVDNIDNLQLMVEKRIPEVLSKYLTIDPDYRTSLKNMEGKNAQELMIDSLKNIADIFQDTYKNLNQDTLHSLSATNKYTKSIK